MFTTLVLTAGVISTWFDAQEIVRTGVRVGDTALCRVDERTGELFFERVILELRPEGAPFAHPEDPYLDTIMGIVLEDEPDSAEQIGRVFDAIHHVNHVRGRRAAA